MQENVLTKGKLPGKKKEFMNEEEEKVCVRDTKLQRDKRA